jgi:hypothetical protein
VENIINELNTYINIGLKIINNKSSIWDTLYQLHDDDLNITYSKCGKKIIISNNGIYLNTALDNTSSPLSRNIIINYKFEEINKHNNLIIPVDYKPDQLMFKANALLENNIAIRFFSLGMFSDWKFTLTNNMNDLSFFNPVAIYITELSNNIMMTSSLSESDPDNFLATIQGYNSVNSKYFTISKTDSFWIDFYDNNNNPIDVRKIMTNIFIELELTL